MEYKYIQDKGESTETETATTKDVKDENEMIIDQRKAANNSFIPSETIFNAIASVFPGILLYYLFFFKVRLLYKQLCPVFYD